MKTIQNRFKLNIYYQSLKSIHMPIEYKPIDFSIKEIYRNEDKIGDGYKSGNGYGNGRGRGSGDGSGYGYGKGNGYGNGRGKGSGYGDGDGYG